MFCFFVLFFVGYILTVTAAQFHRRHHLLLLLVPDPQIKPPHHAVPTGRPYQTPPTILIRALQTRHAFMHRVRDRINIDVVEDPGVEEAEGVVGGDCGDVGGVVGGGGGGGGVDGDDFIDVGVWISGRV